LGKFPRTKLTIVAASLLSVAALSAVFAMPGKAAVQEPGQAAAPAAAPAAQPQPRQVIRRVYVIRRTTSGQVEIVPRDVPVQAAPAPAAPPQSQPAPAPKPAPQPIARSRGS
jgi:hypothetical protein